MYKRGIILSSVKRAARQNVSVGLLVVAFLTLAAAPASVSTSALSKQIGLTVDPSLNEAAARHAREVLADERRANRDHLEGALRLEGLADAQLLPFASIGADAAAADVELLRFVESTVRERGMTHLGLGRAVKDGKSAVVAIFVRRLVELSPLPRRVKQKTWLVRGRADPKDQLEALLLGPCDRGLSACGRETRTVAHRFDRGVLSVPLALAEPGRYAFELLVTRERGPEVAALWFFDFGDAREPEQQAALDDLGGLIDRARSDKELAPLELDPALRTAASAHAAEVCKTMIAAHHSTASGTPADRAKKAGYKGRVTENVAIAPSIAVAHANLMKSPSHRRNILDPLASASGLAVVKKDGNFCVVEMFGDQGR